MREQRNSEVRKLAEGHTAGEWQRWDYDPHTLLPSQLSATAHTVSRQPWAPPGRRCQGEEGPMAGGFCCDIPNIFTELTTFYGKYLSVLLEKKLILIYENFIYISQTTKLK